MPETNNERHGQCQSYVQLDYNTRKWFDLTDKLFNDISSSIKPITPPPPVIEDPGSSIVSEHKQFLKGSSIMSSVFP